jgi:hypothetical protein
LRKIKSADAGGLGIPLIMVPSSFDRSAGWLVLALFAMTVATSVKAQEGGAAVDEPSGGKPESRHRAREVLLDKPHELLSRSVESISRDLDALLGDPNRLYDSTGSTVQLRAHISNFEGGHTEGRANVNAQISLPNTEDRLKVLLQRGLEPFSPADRWRPAGDRRPASGRRSRRDALAERGQAG